MAESSRYATVVDLSQANDSHVLMIRLVGGGKRVLDVGCWNGDMGVHFTRSNPRVVGIEIDRSAAEDAKKVLDDVVIADVGSLDFKDTFGPDAFDVVVFGDVLEHLVDPGRALRQAGCVLARGGYVVSSIPNVAHGSVRLSLLQGRFEYGDLGLLDRTHLRFFTRDTVEQLFSEAGFAVVECRETRKDPLAADEIDLDFDRVPPKVLDELRRDPDSDVYQFVVKAVPDDGTHSVSRLYASYRELSARSTTTGAGTDAIDGTLRLVALAPADLDPYHVDLVAAVLQRELAGRGRDAFVVGTPGDFPVIPGAVADALVSVGVFPDSPHALRINAADLPLDLDGRSATCVAIASLAPRHLGAAELEGRRRFVATVTGLPASREVIIVALDSTPSPGTLTDLVSHLATAGQWEQLVLLAERSHLEDEFPAAEARWGRPVAVIQRPVDPWDGVALLSAATAVVSTSFVDNAVAAALGVPAALWTDDAAAALVLGSLDSTGSETEVTAGWAELRSRASSAIDQLATSLDSVRTPGADQLLASHRSLQDRVAEERRAVAGVCAELDGVIAARSADAARLAALVSELEAVEISLEREHGAVIALQLRCADLVRPLPARPWYRRAGGRMLRALGLR